MIDEDTPLYDEEAEALNELICPRCSEPLKIIGRSGFCENKKCIVFEVLFKFKRQKLTKEQKEFIKLSSQVLNEKGGKKHGINR